MVIVGSPVSPWAPFSISFHSYVWTTWLERLSPHLMPGFQETWQLFLLFLTSPWMSLRKQHLLVLSYGYFKLFHCLPHWRKEMAPALQGRGGHKKFTFGKHLWKDFNWGFCSLWILSCEVAISFMCWHVTKDIWALWIESYIPEFVSECAHLVFYCRWLVLIFWKSFKEMWLYCLMA